MSLMKRCLEGKVVAQQLLLLTTAPLLQDGSPAVAPAGRPS